MLQRIKKFSRKDVKVLTNRKLSRKVRLSIIKRNKKFKGKGLRFRDFMA